MEQFSALNLGNTRYFIQRVTGDVVSLSIPENGVSHLSQLSKSATNQTASSDELVLKLEDGELFELRLEDKSKTKITATVGDKMTCYFLVDGKRKLLCAIYSHTRNQSCTLDHDLVKFTYPFRNAMFSVLGLVIGVASIFPAAWIGAKVENDFAIFIAWLVIGFVISFPFVLKPLMSLSKQAEQVHTEIKKGITEQQQKIADAGLRGNDEDGVNPTGV